MFETSLELKQNYCELLELCMDHHNLQHIFKNQSYFPELIKIVLSLESHEKKIANVAALMLKGLERRPRNVYITFSQEQRLQLTEMMFKYDYFSENCSLLKLYMRIRNSFFNDLNDFWRILEEKIDAYVVQSKSGKIIPKNLLVFENFQKSIKFKNDTKVGPRSEYRKKIKKNESAPYTFLKLSKFDGKCNVESLSNILQKLEKSMLNSNNLDFRLFCFNAYCQVLAFDQFIVGNISEPIFLAMNEIIRSGIRKNINQGFETLRELLSCLYELKRLEKFMNYFLSTSMNISFDLKSREDSFKFFIHVISRTYGKLEVGEKSVTVIFELLKNLFADFSSDITKYKEFRKSSFFQCIRELFELTFGCMVSDHDRFTSIQPIFNPISCEITHRTCSLFVLLLTEKSLDNMYDDAEFVLDYVLKNLREKDDLIFHTSYKTFLVLVKYSRTKVLKRFSDFIGFFIALLSNSEYLRIMGALKMLNSILEYLANSLSDHLPALADRLVPLLNDENVNLRIKAIEALTKLGPVSKSLFSSHLENVAKFLMTKISFDSNEKSVRMAIIHTKLLSKIILLMEKEDVKPYFNELNPSVMKYIDDWSCNISLLSFDLVNSFIQIFPQSFEAHVPVLLEIISFWLKIENVENCDLQKICAFELLSTIVKIFTFKTLPFLHQLEEIVLPLNISLSQIFPPVQNLMSIVLSQPEFSLGLFMKIFDVLLKFCPNPEEFESSIEFLDFYVECCRRTKEYSSQIVDEISRIGKSYCEPFFVGTLCFSEDLMTSKQKFIDEKKKDFLFERHGPRFYKMFFGER